MPRDAAARRRARVVPSNENTCVGWSTDSVWVISASTHRVLSTAAPIDSNRSRHTSAFAESGRTWATVRTPRPTRTRTTSRPVYPVAPATNAICTRSVGAAGYAGRDRRVIRTDSVRGTRQSCSERELHALHEPSVVTYQDGHEVVRRDEPRRTAPCGWRPAPRDGDRIDGRHGALSRLRRLEHVHVQPSGTERVLGAPNREEVRRR